MNCDKKDPIAIGADHQGVTWKEIARDSSYKDDAGSDTIQDVYLERRDGCRAHVIVTRDDVTTIIRGATGEYVTQSTNRSTVSPYIDATNLADRQFPLSNKQATEIPAAARIEAILATPRGAKIERARKAFSNFDREVDQKCEMPKEKISTYEYDGQSRDRDKYSIYADNLDISKDLDEDYYDPDEVYALNIGHLQDWGDGDIDYAGGYTRIVIRLNQKGEIECQFNGMSIDEPFKSQIVALIESTAATLD